MSKKPNGYWQSWENTQIEIEKMWEEHPELRGSLPSQRWMKKQGYDGLYFAAYKYHGGMNSVRKRMGLTILKNSSGYYCDWNNIVSELEKIWQKHPELNRRIPSGNWLVKHGHSGLEIGISRYQGGFMKVREKFGQEQYYSNPRGYLKDLNNLKRAIKNLHRVHPELRGELPSGIWMKRNGYSILASAILRHHNGFKVLREKLGYRKKLKYDHGELKSWDRLSEEIKRIQKEHPEHGGKLPSSNWLNANGFLTVYEAIRNYHGGMNTVREKLRQKPFNKGGYYRNFENLRKDLEQIARDHPELKRSTFSYSWFNKHGYSGIGVAIVRHHGGIKRVRELLGWEKENEENELEELLRGYVEDE